MAGARQNQAKLGPLPSHERERLEQALVILVRPRPSGIEQERLTSDGRVRCEVLGVDTEMDCRDASGVEPQARD